MVRVVFKRSFSMRRSPAFEPSLSSKPRDARAIDYLTLMFLFDDSASSDLSEFLIFSAAGLAFI